jgi:hypothetical protein
MRRQVDSLAVVAHPSMLVHGAHDVSSKAEIR